MGKSMSSRVLRLLRLVAKGVAGLFAVAAAAQPLETAQVQYRDVDLTYAAEAVIEAVKQSTVSAQVTGRIVEVNYDVGDYVKKGQVIVRIDQTEVAQVVAGSQAQVAQAQAAFENARQALERNRELASQKFISQAALDKAESDYRVAEAQLRAAEAGASQASTTRSHTVLVAPYSGVVSARHVEVGEMATPHTFITENYYLGTKEIERQSNLKKFLLVWRLQGLRAAVREALDYILLRL